MFCVCSGGASENLIRWRSLCLPSGSFGTLSKLNRDILILGSLMHGVAPRTHFDRSPDFENGCGVSETGNGTSTNILRSYCIVSIGLIDDKLI